MQREQVVLGAKVGLVPEDVDNDITGLGFMQGIEGVQESDVVNGVCLHPQFIQKSIDESLKNLKVDTLDIIYMSHLENIMGTQDLEESVKRVFEVLEKNVQDGKIQAYGLSSWQGLRVRDSHPQHLELHHLRDWSLQVAGEKNSFSYVQVPVNVMMPEAFMDCNQMDNSLTVMQAADRVSLSVQTVSPLLSGTMINVPIDMSKVPLNYQSARHLQFVRSIGGVTSTIVGMKSSHHVRKNLEVAANPPLSEEEFLGVFVPPSRRAEQPQQPVDLEDLV